MPVAISPSTSQLQLDLALAPPTAGKKVRSDALPEFTRYRDNGCDVHPNCLTCPLPRCRYEEPGGLRALLNERRDRQIVRLRRKGVSVDELAGRFRVSRRTIFRVLGSRKTARKKPAVAAIPSALGRSAGDDVAEERAETRCA